MPLDIPQYINSKLPGQIFPSFTQMQEACQGLPEEDRNMYKVSYIPQDPDPVEFVWDQK